VNVPASPISLQLDALSCANRCRHCETTYGPRQRALSRDEIRAWRARVLREAEQLGVEVEVGFTHREVLDHPDWRGVSEEFGQATLYRALATNGRRLAREPELLNELRERLPNVRLWNFYGQTEMAPLATILGPEEQLSHAGSAGGAALNVETRVVDDDDNPVPPGTVGEIVHRSPHAMLGYYKDEEKTAEAFRNGWFHSGDLGFLDEDGRLSVETARRT
jgi:acyl-CoA synthetase (AMP-forming)/AMP-acid ligase II